MTVDPPPRALAIAVALLLRLLLRLVTLVSVVLSWLKLTASAALVPLAMPVRVRAILPLLVKFTTVPVELLPTRIGELVVACVTKPVVPLLSAVIAVFTEVIEVLTAVRALPTLLKGEPVSAESV